MSEFIFMDTYQYSLHIIIISYISRGADSLSLNVSQVKFFNDISLNYVLLANGS